jgi:hypothetical protein
VSEMRSSNANMKIIVGDHLSSFPCIIVFVARLSFLMLTLHVYHPFRSTP